MVWGRRDRVSPPGTSRLAAERFPDARVELWDVCGHFPHGDQPARTLASVLAATA